MFIQGVPAEGLIDSGAKITIMGGELFKKVATVNRLKKKDFKPDKIPKTYSRETFTLDGVMELHVSFGERTMKTSVYIKMDAYDQLLLSEGVCRQLGIISYHSDVYPGKWKQKDDNKADNASSTDSVDNDGEGNVVVPTVRIQLETGVKLLPQHGTKVRIQTQGDCETAKTFLVEPDSLIADLGLSIEPTVLKLKNGTGQIISTNLHRYWIKDHT